jgi:chromosome segregation ATPase
MIQPGWGGVALAVVLASFGAGYGVCHHRWRDAQQTRDSTIAAERIVYNGRVAAKEDSLRAARKQNDSLRVVADSLGSQLRRLGHAAQQAAATLRAKRMELDSARTSQDSLAACQGLATACQVAVDTLEAHVAALGSARTNDSSRIEGLGWELRLTGSWLDLARQRIDSLERRGPILTPKPPTWWKRPRFTLPVGIGIGILGGMLVR